MKRERYRNILYPPQAYSMKMVNTTNLENVRMGFWFKSDSECPCFAQIVSTRVPKSVRMVCRLEFTSDSVDPALAVAICFPKPSVLGSSGFGLSYSILVEDRQKKLGRNLHRGLEHYFGV